MPMICFFGPDGSGKSTLAKALAKRLSQDGFEVRLSWMRGARTLASSLSAIPMLAFLHTLPLNSLLSLTIGGSIFPITPLTGAITHTDLQNPRLILSRIKIVWPLIRPVLTYEAKLLTTSPKSETP